MKKITNLVLFTLASGAMMAQSLPKLEPTPMKGDHGVSRHVNQTTASKQAGTTYWSEDFGSGIPAGWTNQVLDATGNVNTAAGAEWEYRGPSTTPDVSEGSRGGYASAGDPIVSTTAANGFVIFDSDFLDTDGTAGAFGTGVAPTPHTGVLTTDTIDLTAAAGNQIELLFTSYARKFTADFEITFSADGGLTWTDTVNVYENLGVNSSTANDSRVRYKLPASLAGSQYAMIRFLMGGSDAFYFWMMDDLSIEDLPSHIVNWTVYNGAPAHDWISNGDGGEPKYGITTLKQVRPVGFDSNVHNYGAAAQTNCKLEVEVWNGTTLLTTLSSNTVATLATGDTLTYNDLVTSTDFTASAEGTHTIVYKFSSDSINGVNYPYVTDTFTYYVTDSLMSQDFNVFSNSIGTDMSGIQAVASKFQLENDERLFSVDLRLSTVSQAGGFIEIEVYDTAGFDYSAATPGTNLAYGSYTLTSGDPGTTINIPVADANNGIPYLTTGAYFIVARMSNANGEVRIANDATFPQTGDNSLMYIGGAQWYSGFNNSTTLESPHIRAIFCPAASAAMCMQVGIEEETALTGVSAYPNPTNGFVNVSFAEQGSYDMSIINMVGQTVISNSVKATAGSVERVDLTSLTPGVYFLNIKSGEKVGTYKLTVQ